MARIAAHDFRVEPEALAADADATQAITRGGLSDAHEPCGLVHVSV